MIKKKDPRGRKKVDDKKRPIRIYLPSSTVLKCGGEDYLKEYFVTMANKLARNKSSNV